jgi:hypothetical protein
MRKMEKFAGSKLMKNLKNLRKNLGKIRKVVGNSTRNSSFPGRTQE